MTAASTPMVGLLYNPAVPMVLDALGARVDYVEVIPDPVSYTHLTLPTTPYV